MASTLSDMLEDPILLNLEPDLVGSSFAITPLSSVAGDSLTVDFRIQNSGDNPSGPFDVAFFLSTDTTIGSSADFLITTVSLSSLNGISFFDNTVTLTLPGANNPFWSGSGVYNLGMVVDSSNDVVESNEANNASVGLFLDYAEVFVTVDDAYEENDTLATAYDLSAGEDTFLSSIAGSGIQADDDWYEINITPGFERLQVELDFLHANGDIDLQVYDASGTLITSATSVTDDEFIDVVLANSGTHYLRVYGGIGNTSNTYDLIWDDIAPPVNLTGNFFDVVQEPLQAGDTFTVDFEVANTEAGPIGSFDVDFYLSTNDIISDLDFLLGTATVSSLGGNTTTGILSQTFTLPGVNAPFWAGNGDYTIGMIIDPGNSITESDEADNSNTAEFFDYDTVSITIDDAYEENDTLGTAFDLSGNEATFLSSIAGAGIQADDDWFEIDVTPGFERLQVGLDFIDANGDIDLQVYDASGNLVTSAISVTDDEFIDVILANSGTHYLRVYGGVGNTNNTYDLIWDDLQYLVGTEERDILQGLSSTDTILGLRGDDDLFGFGGDDDLFGDRGDDNLFGGSGDDFVDGGYGDDRLTGGGNNDFLDGGYGDDFLQGVNPTSSDPGFGELDVLVGGVGFDVFALGNSSQVYYDDNNAATAGVSNYALITDFELGLDVIQLRGSANNYVLAATASSLPSGVGIFLDIPSETDELIGIVQGASLTDLTSSDSFTFV